MIEPAGLIRRHGELLGGLDIAHVHGFHRRFCLRSRTGRGSIENPGLVLGLDFGGCCNGVAFRIAADQARQELTLVWRREMVLGSYAPRWVKMRAGGSQLRAIAFVVNHPAVTAAIIGPRTMEQLESQLGADEVVLDDAVLDRIDEIVPPGTTINPADAGWSNPALEPAARRR